MVASFSSWQVVRCWIARRLGPALLAVVIALGLSVVSDARANAPQTMYKYSYGGYASKWGATYDAACNLMNSANPSGWGTGYRWSLMPGQTSCGMFYNGSQLIIQVGPQAGSACADGSNPDTTKPTDSQCGLPPPTCTADKGKVVNTDHYKVSSPTQLAVGVEVCVPVSGTSGGCSFSANGRTGGYDKVTGKWEYQWMGPLVHTGNVCSGNGTGATDPVKEDTPTKCGAGMCTGTVNGVEVCVRCAQTDTANNATKTTANPDGSTTQVTTNTNTTINNNNATTTTTTTTTTTPAGGGTPTTATKTETTNETKDSYCQRNPSDAGCKELDGQASGGDTCDTPPVCKGDAIQCMMVQQQWQTRCNLEREDDIVKAGRALGTAADPMAAQLPTPGNAPQVDVGRISQDPLFAGGALDLNKTIVVAGMPVTIDATYVTQYAELMGYVNLICTAFVCAYMLKGVF